MFDLKLSPAQEQLLRDQVIGVDQPGTVLRDFQMLLDFVGAEGVPAAGKYNLLPIAEFGELDRRLSHPLKLQMKRPQLRSHPYLQGLHLLLRATGLGRVEGSGSKARLVLDPAVLERWTALNPTERYFTLLEAWLRVGREEMVGEQGRSGWFLSECVATWANVPAEGRQFNLRNPQFVYVGGVGRAFYHVALMDMFGLMQVEQPPPEVRPWCPAGLRRVPFGDAVFTLLAGWLFSFAAEPQDEEEDLEEEEFEDEDGEAPAELPLFGTWQPLFQPYFPEWRNNLVLPAEESREGVFVFKVSLGGGSGGALPSVPTTPWTTW
jgi:hypothetical protein